MEGRPQHCRRARRLACEGARRRRAGAPDQGQGEPADPDECELPLPRRAAHGEKRAGSRRFPVSGNPARAAQRGREALARRPARAQGLARPRRVRARPRQARGPRDRSDRNRGQ